LERLGLGKGRIGKWKIGKARIGKGGIERVRTERVACGNGGFERVGLWIKDWEWEELKRRAGKRKIRKWRIGKWENCEKKRIKQDWKWERV
jgi:hypothetical protein